MQKIKVINEKIDTTLFSFHPDSSKWWCNGAILNNLLPPVILKNATCAITDNVSNTGIKAIIKRINGILIYNAIAEITPPKSKDPVSPINTFAVFRLNIKNPKHAPIIILPNTITSFISNIIAITVKQVVIIAETDVLNPIYSIC